MSGSECLVNPPALVSGGESNNVLQIASLNSYVSGNADSKVALLFISNIHGYGVPKFRKLADKVASAGYYVVAPDFFHGDPITPETPISDWLKNHGPVEAVEPAKLVIKALKEMGITKIGAAGFCWGGKVAVELAKEDDIQVAALLHPSFVTLDDIKGVKVPTAILGAEIDNKSPPELVKEFELALQAKLEVDHFVKIYGGVSHGWTVRYKDEDAEEVRSAEEAHEDLVGWFNNHLDPNHSII
ncbi:hypothetical protein Lser_V15G23450 [Lactuca serriola]